MKVLQSLLGKMIAMMFVSVLMIAGMAGTAAADSTGGLKPLKSVPVPLPENIGDFVVNKQAAIQLGKALFWDMQVGGDGVQACATCHFQAGSDVRITNTVNPGANGIFDTIHPGQTLTRTMFPINTGDVVGSQGVLKGNFLGLSGGPVDLFTLVPDPIFNVGGVNVRQVTGRNAPSAINAVFYFRNFWDGRANNCFNGVDPSGCPDGGDNAATDSGKFVWKVVNGVPNWVSIRLRNASLASQAVGPPNNPVEMSFAGRTFAELGRKMLGLTPLGLQTVHPTDSVLGPLAASPTGLTTSYRALIQQAFDPKWWDSNDLVAGGFNVMESNFSLFWGISVMLYESTLVSDQTPLDRFLAGNTSALTANQQKGMAVYNGKGRCDHCHGGAELTAAAVSQTGGDPKNGFFNTAVRPVAEDGGDILQPGQAKFKTPTLRNVELNGPYFHNGNQATLRQVVDFYDRGGDFPNDFTDSQVRKLGLSSTEKNALVDFMVAMTDERVKFERAPFDHPSLNIPNGANLPAVGAAGRATPLPTFLGVSPFLP